MNILAGTKERVENDAIDIFIERSQKIIEEKGKCTIGLCGGGSIQGILNRLKSRAKEIDWKNIHVFMVDERRVPITDERSNYKQAHDMTFRLLLEKSIIPEENLHPFTADMSPKEYTKELRRYGGFDISFFGVGGDSHIAGIFPNKDDENGFFALDDSPKPPKERMTLSRDMVTENELIFLLFFGETKRNAFEMFNNDSYSSQEVPAKLALDTDTIVVTNLESNK